jgi:hypothetical protein
MANGQPNVQRNGRSASAETREKAAADPTIAIEAIVETGEIRASVASTPAVAP